jgi:hypothetical protein
MMYQESVPRKWFRFIPATVCKYSETGVTAPCGAGGLEVMEAADSSVRTAQSGKMYRQFLVPALGLLDYETVQFVPAH